jgi:hypothetical protein
MPQTRLPVQTENWMPGEGLRELLKADQVSP